MNNRINTNTVIGNHSHSNSDVYNNIDQRIRPNKSDLKDIENLLGDNDDDVDLDDDEGFRTVESPDDTVEEI